MLARLGTRLSLLTTGSSDLPERHRTLRNTIEWSHDLLEAERRRLFARLGSFSGGWTLEAADVICGPGLEVEVLDGLGIPVGRICTMAPGASSGTLLDRRRTMSDDGRYADEKRRWLTLFRQER